MLDNPLLTTVGSLIGVSGSILSYIMVSFGPYIGMVWQADLMKCVAMNRSITNVLFGGIAPTQTNKKIEGEVTTTAIEETVDALAGAENVIIVCIHGRKFDSMLI